MSENHMEVQHSMNFLRYEGCTLLTMKATVWDVTPWILVDIYGSFRGIYWLHNRGSWNYFTVTMNSCLKLWLVTARIDGLTSQEGKSRILVPLALFLYVIARLFSVGYLFFPAVLSLLILKRMHLTLKLFFCGGESYHLLFVTSIRRTPVENTLR
jgi:hypothetical protein